MSPFSAEERYYIYMMYHDYFSFPSGSTEETAEALTEVRNTMFTTVKGRRQYADGVVILLTDGEMFALSLPLNLE